jgi:hypothetical protein
MNLNDLHICFDVDGTLIHDEKDGPKLKGKPRYIVIELFKCFEDLGANLFIWSGGGTQHAEEVRDRLGLEATIIEKGSFKPEIAIDNNPNVKLGKVNINVGPDGNDDLKVAFDVDGTLVYNGDPDYTDDDGEPLDGTPRYPVIKLYEALLNFGADMYVWSSHGEEFSQMWKDKLGLSGMALAKKDIEPDLAVDNKDFNLAKVTIPV